MVLLPAVIVTLPDTLGRLSVEIPTAVIQAYMQLTRFRNVTVATGELVMVDVSATPPMVLWKI